MQYNIANLPALMLRETPMLSVSVMMLHHLIVTFKIYLMFVWCASRAAPCIVLRALLQWIWPRRGGWGVQILLAEFAHGCSPNSVGIWSIHIDHGGANFV